MRAGDLLQAKEYAIRALEADARSRPAKLAVRPEAIKERAGTARAKERGTQAPAGLDGIIA